MYINLRKRRRGSLGLEAIAIVPFAIIMILLSRFILEAMLTRHEVAVYTRGSTVSAAISSFPELISCTFDKTAFSSRPNVNQSATVSCRQRDGEIGLNNEKPFFDAIRDGASAWTNILRDVDRNEPVMDMFGEGSGSMAFQRPDFLATRGDQATSDKFLTPRDELFDHSDNPYTAAHDPVIWAELRKSNVYKLFPNVFPSKDK